VAYLKKIETPRCRTCGARASVEVFNNRNSSCGCYCARCGRSKLKEFQQQEERVAVAVARKEEG
jgi:hypothetical protein